MSHFNPQCDTAFDVLRARCHLANNRLAGEATLGNTGAERLGDHLMLLY